MKLDQRGFKCPVNILELKKKNYDKHKVYKRSSEDTMWLIGSKAKHKRATTK